MDTLFILTPIVKGIHQSPNASDVELRNYCFWHQNVEYTVQLPVIETYKISFIATIIVTDFLIVIRIQWKISFTLM